MDQALKELNLKQREFVREHVLNMKTPGAAYKTVYGVESNNVAKSAGNRLLTKVDVQKAVKSLEERYKEIAPRAFDRQVELLESNQTPANVTNDIAKFFQAMAGYVPTTKVENKTETTFKGLTELSKEDLKKMLNTQE